MTSQIRDSDKVLGGVGSWSIVYNGTSTKALMTVFDILPLMMQVIDNGSSDYHVHFSSIEIKT